MVDWSDGGDSDNIDMDALLRNINKALKNFNKHVENGDKAFVNVEAQLVKMSTRFALLDRNLKKSMDLKSKENRIRHGERVEQDEQHGAVVRRNKEFAHALGQTTNTLSFVTQSLTKGRGIGATMGMFTSSIYNATQQVAKLNKLRADSRNDPTNKPLAAALKDAEDAIVKTGWGASKQGSKIVNSLSKAHAFFTNHHTGLMFGAGFAGLLVGVITKALSVAPMFQAMMKMFTFAVTMILMPIGTFIGAMLKPIIMGLIQGIAPQFGQWMTWSMDFGTKVGNFLINPLDATSEMIKGAFSGDTTDQAGLGILGVGGLTSALILKKGLGGLLGKGAGVMTSGISSTASLGKAGFSLGNLLKGAGSAAKGAATVGGIGGILGGGSKLANISGTALAGKIAANLGTKLGLGTAAKFGLAAAFKAIPIVGWATMATAAVGSGLKEMSPDSYQGLRDATSFLQFGDNDIIRDVLGIGETTLLEDFRSFGEFITGNPAAHAMQEGMADSAEHGVKMMENMEEALRVMGSEHAPEMEANVKIMLKHYTTMKDLGTDQMQAAAQTADAFKSAYETVKAKMGSWVKNIPSGDDFKAKKKEAQKALNTWTFGQNDDGTATEGWGSLAGGSLLEAEPTPVAKDSLQDRIDRENYRITHDLKDGINYIEEFEKTVKQPKPIKAPYVPNAASQAILDAVAEHKQKYALPTENELKLHAMGELYGLNLGKGYADGGWIREPVVGIGRNSGQTYNIGERGAEYVTPNGGGKSGNVIINIGRIERNADFNQLKPMIQRWILEANSRRGMI